MAKLGERDKAGKGNSDQRERDFWKRVLGVGIWAGWRWNAEGNPGAGCKWMTTDMDSGLRRNDTVDDVRSE